MLRLDYTNEEFKSAAGYVLKKKLGKEADIEDIETIVKKVPSKKAWYQVCIQTSVEYYSRRRSISELEKVLGRVRQNVYLDINQFTEEVWREYLRVQKKKENELRKLTKQQKTNPAETAKVVDVQVVKPNASKMEQLHFNF